jgi:hypothetical protein
VDRGGGICDPGYLAIFNACKHAIECKGWFGPGKTALDGDYAAEDLRNDHYL